jgi:hypothetical protein
VTRWALRTGLHAGWLCLLCTGLFACTDSVTILRDTSEGGLIAYPIKHDGEVLSAPGRGEAMRFIEDKCGRRYRILREGEVPRVQAKVDKLWQGQLSGDRQWGLQFSCAK